MKKNFVKKTLASTLALAMVATAMPAAFTTASAAKAPALNKTSKTLYINDNEIGSSFDFNISNKVAKSTYKWTTSNKAVATVNSKGLTKAATKTGKATISCKITLPTKKTKTLKATVTVKENATKVWVKNAPEKEIGIGEKAYDFNSSFSTASGATATDYRQWQIEEGTSNTAGATIDAKSGVVTTKTAGEFKVRVVAYQNKARLAANDTSAESEWLTVKVQASITAVAQSVSNAVKVTFDDNMKDKVKATDFVIKNKATGAVQSIKGISFSDDGKDVTLETFVSFADAGTYTLTYAGADKEFNTSIGEVASLTISPATVTVDSATKVVVKAFNANGVDITSEKASSITVADSENANGWYNDSTKEITIYKVGGTAKITATYHTNKFDTTGTEVGAVKAEAVITAVDKTVATYAGTKYVVQTSAPNFDKVTENTNMICVDDSGMKLYVKVVGNDGKEITNYGDLSVASGDENTLLCASSFDGNSIALTAVKDGSTVVIIKEASTGKALFTIPVVVKAKRAAATVSLDKSTVSVTKSNTASVNSANVTATVKDQYTQEIKTANVTKLESISKPTGVSTDDAKALVSFDGKKVTATASSTTVKGTYQYKVFSGDKFTVLTVNVLEANEAAATGYRLDANASEVDTSVTSTDDLTKKVTIKTLVTKGGVDAAVLASGTSIDAKTKVTYKLTDKDGNDVTTKYLKANAEVVEFALVDTTSGVAVKVPTGTYTITSTVETLKDSTWTTATVRKQGIVVKDTQSAVTATVSAIKTSAVDPAAVITDTCKFSFDGKTYAKDSNSDKYTVTVDPANVKTVASDTSKVFISSVTVNIEVATGVTVAFTAAVNTTFTVGQ